MNKTDENTPYLDSQEALLGKLDDPLDQFLDIPKHSAENVYLSDLFQPLCSNHSVAGHRSGKFVPRDQIAVWLDDSIHLDGGRRGYGGVMTDREFLKTLKTKVNSCKSSSPYGTDN